MKQYLIILILILASFPVMADLQSDGELVSSLVSPYITADTMIVKGTYSSKIEKVVLAYIRTNYPQAKDVPVIFDSEATDVKQKTIILLGGPMQNLLSDEILSKPDLIVHNFSTGIVSIYEGEKTYIVFSDHQGYNNLPKTGPEKSPLAKFMPIEAVPLAATSISLFLLWIGKLLFHLLTKVIKFKIGSKIMKRVKRAKKLKEHFIGFHVKGVRFKMREILSILIAASIFAIAVSYNYLFKDHKIAIIITTIAVNALIYLIRNGVRLVMDKVHGMHTEYHVWYWGAFITIVSGWLGNTFALAGFILSEEKKNDKGGQVAFMVNILTFCVFLVFGVWNILAPNPAIQMAMILSISLCFLQMLPMTPFSGKKIYAWKKGLWWISFVPIVFCYLIINLV